MMEQSNYRTDPVHTKQSVKKIYVNMVQCKKCHDIIVSQTVHDFKECQCGAIAVDGGKEYLKRVGDLDQYFELTQYED